MATATGGVIDGGMLLPEVLRAYPQARTVFDRHGLRGCGGPLGPHETVGYFARVHGVDATSTGCPIGPNGGYFARVHGVDEATLLAELEEAARRTLARTLTLEQAARLRGVEVGPLVRDLNRAAGRPTGEALTVLS